MIAALLPLALQVADPLLFAPPLGRTFVVAMEQVRSVGGKDRRYRSTRTVAFRRNAGGLVAELVITRPADEPADAGGSDLFARTVAALAGRTVRFRLDGAGQVLAVEDADAHWAHLLDALAALPGGERFAGPLRGFPPPARTRFLASMLDPVMPARVPVPGRRPVSVAARAPAGAAMTLAGQERVARRGDGTVQVTVDATGDDGEAAVTIARRDVLDPATGLRVSHEERRRTAMLGKAAEGALTVEERWTVTMR